VGEAPGRYGSHILVLVRFSTYAARRRREAALLSRLAALPADIANRIPRFYFEEEAGGAQVFVLQEFPGVTLDAPGAGLRTATREAAQFLLRLHMATRRPARLTAASAIGMFGAAFETARERYPALVSTLKRLEEVLQNALTGADLPLVWMHGDFKIENIVIDERTHRLLGVIDWEHSEPEGLPLLDLWYLILYNRQIERGVDFLAVMQDFLPPRQFTSEEASICSEYVRTLEIPSRLVPALAGAMILHHVTRRVKYDSNDTGVMDSLRALLNKAMAWIEGAQISSPTGVNGATRNA
jgi:Ser/Thr protein kinase RdoA (MazF antagonist)